jgi:2-polyprenyl-3-methyl-5-hydroxy-6-metoxy-1,4-benzoquinol methylase
VELKLMVRQVPRPAELDAEALAFFAQKGRISGIPDPQAGRANGVKVRRVVQLTQDLLGRQIDSLRILDLACGDGVYSIEAGLHGAQVVAVDARLERMGIGAECAARHGLHNVRFQQGDIRRVAPATHGMFDAVYALGILYHLDAPDLFALLDATRALCTGILVIDTLTCVEPTAEVFNNERRYSGEWVREHADDDPDSVRQARLLRSIDNTFAFRLTKESLVRALHDAGWTSIVECYAPFEPLKPGNRVTLAALGGASVTVRTYPWINGCTEFEVAEQVASFFNTADQG